MNILIIGAQATGKSVLAQALKEYHANRFEGVMLFDDGGEATASLTVAESRKKTAEVRLKETKGKRKKHTICVMQTGGQLMVNPDLFDYMIQTSKFSK